MAAFILWTALLFRVDMRPIGPNGSLVGFSTLNQFVHSATGVHMSLYAITDWLSLIPIIFAVSFAILGLSQLIRRKSISKVDRNILILGGFYIAVMIFYVLFEIFPVNYRPILINGVLEASYPSSTTLLTLCIMPTTAMQLNKHIKKPLVSIIHLFTAFMVIARLVSGVHWLSDIIGGVLLSASLVNFYTAFAK